MTSTDENLPQTPVRLSECRLLWELQQKFYESHGVEAWNGRVPWYITNNPYIANAYAQVVVRFFLDCKRANLHHPLEPFYIVECGGGTGLFAFYMLRRLLELRDQLQLQQINFLYVLTDLSEKNVRFWQNHPALRDFIRMGVLDMATWNATTEQSLKLLNSRRTLSAEDTTTRLKNPVVILANYFFDTLPHDAFRVREGMLEEGLVMLRSRPPASPELEADDALRLSAIKTDFTFQEARLPYYDSPSHNAVLEHYARELDTGSILFPIGPLRCVDTWRDIFGDRLLLLATDKASTHTIELMDENVPQLIMHDESFSLTTNFHALGLYFRQCGGFYRHQSNRQSIITSLFSLGIAPEQSPETASAFTTFIDMFGPGNLFTLYRNFEQNFRFSPLDTIIAYLRLLQYDPYLLDLCMEAILLRIKKAEPVLIRDLLDIMHRTATNFYQFPGRGDTLATVGIFFQEVGDFETAIHYYDKSLQYYGENITAHYNKGLCQYQSGNLDHALLSFRAVLSLSPEHIMARGWREKTQEELSVVK